MICSMPVRAGLRKARALTTNNNILAVDEDNGILEGASGKMSRSLHPPCFKLSRNNIKKNSINVKFNINLNIVP